MSKKVKRTVLLLLIALILFSASMVIAGIQNTTVQGIMQGAALGLMLAGFVSVVLALIENFKTGKTPD